MAQASACGVCPRQWPRTPQAEACSTKSSYHSPLAPQQPFRGRQQQQQQKNDGHVPQLFGVAHRDARLGIGNFAGQLGKVLRRPVAPARLAESFSSRSRFCSVWKFSATPSMRGKVSTSRPSSSLPRVAITSVRYDPGWSAVHPREMCRACSGRASSRLAPPSLPARGCALRRARPPQANNFCRARRRKIARGRRQTASGWARRRRRAPACPSPASASNCCQNSSCVWSPSGWLICQRQVPPVASTAVRPRP